MRRWVQVGLVAAVAIALTHSGSACTILDGDPVRLDIYTRGILKVSVMRNGQHVRDARIDLYLGGEESSRGLVLESFSTREAGEVVARNLPLGTYEGVVLVPGESTLRLNFHVPSKEPIQASAGALTITVFAAEGAPEEVFTGYAVPVDQATLALQPVRRAFRETSVTRVSDLRGFVQDATGAVIQRVEIALYRSGEKPDVVSRTRTDDAGRFTFNAPDGSYVLKFSSPGFMNAYVPIELKLGGWAGMKLTMQIAATDSCGFDRDGQPTERFRVEPI